MRFEFHLHAAAVAVELDCQVVVDDMDISGHWNRMFDQRIIFDYDPATGLHTWLNGEEAELIEEGSEGVEVVARYRLGGQAFVEPVEALVVDTGELR